MQLDVIIAESVSEINSNQWNNLVSQSSLGSVFHRTEWLELTEEALAVEPRHIVVSKRNNPIAVFPNVITDVSLPAQLARLERLPLRELVSFSPGYGGPVIATEEDDSLDHFFEAISALGGRTVLFHLVKTSGLEYLRYSKPFAKHGYEPELVNCRFVIDITRDWDALEADMSGDRRRRIREAEDSAVWIREEPLTEETMRRTYDDYLRNIERLGGHPFEYSFFEGLKDHLADRVKVATAVVDDRAIGSYVFVLDDERSTLHHYLPAIGDADDFEYRPSELLHSFAMKWGKANGYERYDMGGTGAHYKEGVFRYKEQYGGDLVPTLQWRKGFSRVGSRAYKVGRALYQKSAY